MPSQVPSGRGGRLTTMSRRGVKRPRSHDIEEGSRVRALRMERNLTQSALADQLELTFQQIQKYEKGTNRIGAGRLQTIVEIFQVPIAELFSASPRLSERQVSLFELVDSAAALRLHRAYKRLPNSNMKQALV